MTVFTGSLKVLAATASILVMAGMTMPAQAGGLSGVVSGVTNTAGGLIGGAGHTVDGVKGEGGWATGSTTGSSSQQQTSSTTSSTTNDRTFGYQHFSKKALVKLKVSVVGIRAGVYVLDSYGNLVRVNTRIADHLVKAKAKVYVLQHGSLVKVYANARLAGLNAKAKIYVIDKYGNILNGKAFVSLGGLKAKITAKALNKNGKRLAANAKIRLGGTAALKARANAGTNGVKVQVALGLGLLNGGSPGGPGNGNGGNNGNNGGNNGNNGAIGREIASLSASERRQLMRKCPSVLSSPASYSAEAVRVCRVVGQLAGL